MAPSVQVLAHASVAKWFSLGTYQASFRLDERSVLSVHLVVESASVAEVVTSAVSSPQRRRSCAAVHTLAALCRCRTVKTTNWLIPRCSNASCQREATFGDVDRTNSNGILPPLLFISLNFTLSTKLRPCESILTVECLEEFRSNIVRSSVSGKSSSTLASRNDRTTGKFEVLRRSFKKKTGGFRRVSVPDADTKSRRSVMGVACSCRHTISSDYQSKSRVSLGPWPFEGLVDRTRSSDSGLLIAGTTFQMGLHDEGWTDLVSLVLTPTRQHTEREGSKVSGVVFFFHD